MSILSDLRTLYHLTLAPARGRTHAERIESFYSRQAEDYDAFRERLLHGRGAMYRSIPVVPGGNWLDIGGGTGANIEHLVDALPRLGGVWIVDLSPSLLSIAQRRITRQRWSNVHTLHADATNFDPPAGPVDVITFSYSLTMIPDWCAALEHAWDLLRPGGTIGVVDFYVSHKHPPAGRVRHGWITRTLWPSWFATDSVFLSPDILAWLGRRFECFRLEERRGPIPYLPFARVPYFTFLGRKPSVRPGAEQ